ncbi:MULTISPECIES: transcriptional regulator [Metallosphaera]|uniref:transcriptional regulator n=1 Tax=Metallosphaera TaxID=41980 RepID=UPI001EDD9E51|nr:transcriptional regulator [Metallosphaera javensis (ex Hofmann et al. 2022)]
MKWETPCEQAFNTVVPYLRVAIMRRLVDRKVPVKRAAKLIGLSATSYEKRVKDEMKLKTLLSDPEISDMIDGVASRIISGERVEETTFCLLCSRSREIFGLPPCMI